MQNSKSLQIEKEFLGKEDIRKENSAIFYKFLIVLILFFSLFLRFYWGLEKEGLHIDEVVSFIMANRDASISPLSLNEVYTGESILRWLFFDDASIKDAVKDISRLYYYNTDIAHTNLYYSLLRLGFLGRSTFDFKNVIHTGVAINCLFFIVGFFFLYKLLALLFKERLLILVGLFCATVSGGAISTTLFLRPYQLQSMMLIILTYVIFKIIVEKKFTKKMFAVSSFSVAGSLLSGYFSIIFIALFGLFLLIYYFLHKEFKRALYFIAGFLTGAILTQFLYLKYWKTIFNNFWILGPNRAEEVYQKLNFQYFRGNVTDSIQYAYNFLSEYALYDSFFFLLVIISYFFFAILIKKQTIKINYLTFGIVLISLLFSLIVITLAPLKIMRYIMPVFPLVALVIPLGVSIIKNKFIKNVILLVLIILFTINSFNIEKISYLYKNKLNDANFLKGNNSVICIITAYNFRNLYFVPYAKNDQRYLFFDDADIFERGIDSRCNYIIIDKAYGKNEFDNLRNQIYGKAAVSSELLTVGDDDVPGFGILKIR